MKYLIGLKRPHDSFFDPETRLYLHFYNSRDYVDRMSPAIERGLKGGTLVDLTDSNASKDQQKESAVKAEEKVEATETQEMAEAEDAATNEEEVDLSELTKAELLEYIEKKGISLKDLSVAKNASAAKIREALEAYLAK